MKAYIASDRNGDSGTSIVVFAETAGQAKAYACASEMFDAFTFTEMRVNRCKALDGIREAFEKGFMQALVFALRCNGVSGETVPYEMM